MLPKKKRIPRQDFSEIISRGKRYHSPHFFLYTLPASISKFSFSVSKKVATHAVDRNKLRRRGYSVISKHTEDIKTGVLCFFSFKKGSTTISFSVLEKEIVDLLKSAAVIS